MTLGEIHRRYTRKVNFREGWRGHLWQERFASFPTDDTYLLNAARYIELNPVRANLAKRPEEYRWSSARIHIFNLPDPLVDAKALLDIEPEWRMFPCNGTSESMLQAIRLHENTGRPLGNSDFISKIETLIGRVVTPRKAGRKPKKNE